MSSITVHGVDYETVYDTENAISLPTLCPDGSPTVNNINLSALKSIVATNPNGLWSDESLNDFRDFLENPPADKVFVTIGEIILSPQNNPEQYYKFNQEKSKDGKKVYLFVEKLETSKKKKKRMRKVKTEPVVKKITKEKVVEKPVKEKQQPLIADAPVKPRKKKENVIKEENIEVISAECFFLMKMAEAMEEYCKITFPSDLKKYRKLKK